MIKNFPDSKVSVFSQQIDYQEGQVASKTLAQDQHHSLTLFAFEKGEEISSHESSGDALVLGLDGIGEITIAGQIYTVGPGDSIVMPATLPHAIFAPQRFKMFLAVSF